LLSTNTSENAIGSCVKLFGRRTYLVDCLLSELGWKWFCRVRVEVLINRAGGVWQVVSVVG